MDFTKKVNDFGLFGSVLVVNNDIMESATKTEEEVLTIAAHITSKAARITNRAVSDQVKDGKLTAFEGASTNITLVTPNLKDIKLFTEAVIKTAEDGNMCHMKDYVRETGNNIPREIWDYIYELTNGK